MKIPRWVSVVALLSSAAFLFGCGMAGSGSSTSSGKGGLTITTAALPDATVSQTYSGALQAAGGTSPYSWNVVGGTLPTGLSVTTSGQIAGTPTVMGSYTFQAQVTDAAKKSSSSNVHLKVTGPPPSIYNISPTSGSTDGGTPVTISGKNLQSGATVTFGGVAGTSVTVVNSSEMTAVTPPHAAGSVDVTVTNPGGRSATLATGFGYGSAAPSLSAVSPNSGPTSGGTSVKITGSNFAAGALVFFGTVAATGVNVTSATQIQATTPSVSTAAAVSVEVKNPDGQSGSLTNGFTYTDSPSNSAPTVTDVSPSTATDGSSVNVDGTNFASGAAVDIGSTAASSVKFVSSTQLSTTVPNISAGTYDVTVTNSNGLSATLSSGLTVTDPTSLLSGCTVNASNQPVCGSNVGSATVPSGWTLVVADGFEGGKLAKSADETLHGTDIECSFAHGSGCAEHGKYTSNGQGFRWILNGGTIGSSGEVYVSWWEYLDSSARLNGEMFLATALQNTSTKPQSDILDWWGSPDNCLNGQGPGPSYNCENAQVLISPQSNATGGVNAAYYASFLNGNFGGWRQYEWHFKANTPGSSDGQAELYINGQLFKTWSNKNFNGSINMAGFQLEIGGTYTSSATTDSTGATCKVMASTSYQHWCNPFSACTPCPIPPDFNRYWDDIIVLRK